MENKDGWHLESSPQFLIHHIGITVINQKKKSSKLSIAWKAISELFKVWGTKIEPTPHIKDKYFYYPKYQMWFMSRGFQCPNRSQVLQWFPSLKIEKKNPNSNSCGFSYFFISLRLIEGPNCHDFKLIRWRLMQLQIDIKVKLFSLSCNCTSSFFINLYQIAS